MTKSRKTVLRCLVAISVTFVGCTKASGPAADTGQEQKVNLSDTELRESESLVSPEVKVNGDGGELAIREDLETSAPSSGEDRPMRISEAAASWQKGQDSYIDFLRKETFEQSLYRTYMGSEFIFVIGNFPNSQPSYYAHITLLARTRRFAKLLWHVRQTKEKGNVESVIATIDATVKRFTEARRDTTALIERMMEEEPENFRSDSPENLRRKANALLRGFGVLALNVPEGVIPLSLEGTQLGVVASTFLLGYCEHPKGVKILLDIVAYDDEPLITKLVAAFEEQDPEMRFWLRHEFIFENRVVLADALDRIMMACYRDQTVNEEALAVAKQYRQWRQQQDLPEREVVEVFAYESPKTPHHLPGHILDVKAGEITETTTLELPLQLIVSDVDVIPDEKIIGQIIDFAERFQAALSEK